MLAISWITVFVGKNELTRKEMVDVIGGDQIGINQGPRIGMGKYIYQIYCERKMHNNKGNFYKL